MARKIFVTCALPYANGSIHLGHMLEHIQADIWVRYQRLKGNEIHFVCADDTHGTPVMIKAKQLGITPEEMLKSVAAEHKADFSGFEISFDNYYSTHSPENQFFSNAIYNKLKERGYIASRKISQLFDPEKKMFLPDRFVKGTCPKCKAADQYGDNCEACGATYSPTELINPYSAISGAKPELKETEHFFFDLPQFEGVLKDWIKTGAIPDEMANKLNEWFDSGLQQWDISRDAPYFGFEIPDQPGKYFYVWLDAPIGYLGSFKNYCDRVKNVDFEDYIKKDSDCEMYHFIGKDILYFHSLFWPAMLNGAEYRMPTKLFIHGYVTVNGAKMSKSKGTFIKAATFLKHFPAETLRYYYAAKSNACEAKDQKKIIVNAATDDDVRYFCRCLYQAISTDKTFVFRSAASFVKCVGGISDQGLLNKEEMIQEANPNGGIIVVGSHTEKTTRQLNELLKLDGLVPLEFRCSTILESREAFEKEISRLLLKEEEILSSGRTAVIYTERLLISLEDDDKEKALARSVAISDGVCRFISELKIKPSFVLAKGGITSADVAVKGLNIRKAKVLGQIQPGVPVWQAESDSRFPHIPYVIFPGNVGDDETLKNAALRLL